MNDGRMVLALTGWMDGGDVSTGTVEWLAGAVDGRQIATIDPEGYYISNFPGSMEMSALFRPHVEIVEGEIQALSEPINTLMVDEKNRLLLFSGKEPNLNWRGFADRLLGFAEQAGVTRIYFVGSYAGMVPHTREPRLSTTVSEPGMKEELSAFGLRLANYEGPGSFSTYLMTRVRGRGIGMASVVAEIPSYIQGTNPKCIEAVIRKLVAILGLSVDFDELRGVTDAWEQRLNEVLQGKEELRELIGRLEASYDHEVFDTQMGDLKDWLEQQGIRVD